ncbi:40-residue YVTN family beta-propeller repeat-containing protein [Roseovarius marisflavi]|uniref:40-residue YVTN family beta-propeller repeat-containing protein n=1 Tax=Roseovarius marisflavi TaxID=1054996 RepID=A0A1M7DF97_9RHOB|nr:thiosulfate oxidation carrier complex protein SoxZ [Roseovarius marisflavi]SHL78191.1 40-residue YVTN family beta-propeller repeat-containing protein [Roseovarius marisflavi]
MRRLAFATALATLLTTPALAGKVFVSNERGNTVTVLDSKTWEVLKEFPAGNRPRGIIASPDGKKLYVCASDDDVVRVTDAGERHVAERYLKTSGQGACAAPPGTDPVLALATLGDMELAFLPALDAPSKSVNTRIAALAGKVGALDVDISHPSHSGLQMDQITLLYIPLRVVGEVDVDLDNTPYLRMSGSISLSENPRLRVSVPEGTSMAEVTLHDTDGKVTRAHTSLAAY